MELKVGRIIIFTNDMEGMADFYRNVLECKLVSDEPQWKDFDAGGIRIALHKGTSVVGRHPPKIAFYAKDVPAVREELVARGVDLGSTVTANNGLAFCDGKDPDGNPFTISNR